MIVDMLNGFKGYYQKYGDDIILKQYDMKQGLYVLLNKDGIKNTLYLEDGIKERSVSADNIDLYDYFREKDYKSILILYDTNKKVAGKSIHSNNYLTLFARKRSFYNKDMTINPAMMIAADEYFETFERYRVEEEYVKKCNKILKPNQEILREAPVFNKDLYSESKSIIKNNIYNILNSEEVKNLKDDEYIRIFVEAPIEQYNDEYTRYMIRKVFNKDKYHIFKNGTVYGLSNADMGTNPNKPSLELKGMKVQVPFKVSFKEALMIQKLYDFLYFYNVPRKNNTTNEIEYVNSIYKTLYIPSDFNIDEKDLTKYYEYNMPVYYVKTGNGISFNIVDFDIIPPYSKKIEFNLKDYLGTSSEEYENSPYKQYNFLYQLENAVDYFFFNKKLIPNYHEDKIKISQDILSKNMINLIYLTRDAFYEWFRKGNTQIIKENVNSFTIKIIKARIIMLTNLLTEHNRISLLFNFRISLLNYFNLGGMFMSKLKEIRENLMCIVESGDELTNDDEYFYLAGQMVYYLASKSESSNGNKTQEMLKPFITCKNISSLKDKILQAYNKYSYSIYLNDTRFNNVLAMLMGYDCNSKFQDNIDMFISGLLSKNILFTKTKKNQNKKSNDNIDTELEIAAGSQDN